MINLEFLPLEKMHGALDVRAPKLPIRFVKVFVTPQREFWPGGHVVAPAAPYWLFRLDLRTAEFQSSVAWQQDDSTPDPAMYANSLHKLLGGFFKEQK